MTADDKNLEAFYRNIADIIVEKNRLSHYPHTACFSGICEVCMRLKYKWTLFVNLVTTIWKIGPDVSENWMKAAAHTDLGFTADELHGIILGVYRGAVVTADDKNLEAFYRNIADIIVEKNRLSHYPHTACFSGICEVCMRLKYKWTLFVNLVTTIWKIGPDVSENWMKAAAHTDLGFTADELHGIILGVYIGGDRPLKRRRPPLVWTISKKPIV